MEKDTPGSQLAQELAQLIINEDETAIKVALINIVGMLLDDIRRIADAQAIIAQLMGNVVVHKDTVHVRNMG